MSSYDFPTRSVAAQQVHCNSIILGPNLKNSLSYYGFMVL